MQLVGIENLKKWRGIYSDFHQTLSGGGLGFAEDTPPTFW